MDEDRKIIPELSVIVPIYNVAPYIQVCVESLFNQTLKNIEYIFVDDCSTDNSLEILNSVIAKYPDRRNIKILQHKINQGSGKTRADGINVATGKWIIHCDSDDYLSPRAYEILIDTAEKTNSDIVICSLMYFNEQSEFYKMSQGVGDISSDILLARLSGVSKERLHGSLCNKLIRRSLWNGVVLSDNISYWEDMMALFLLVDRKKDLKISLIPDYLYYYRIRSNSLIHTLDIKHQREVINLIYFFENLIRDNNRPENSYFISCIISLLYNLLRSYYDIKEFSNSYKRYLPYISINKKLNFFEKLHLNVALRGHQTLSLMLSYCNNIGRKYIKKLKNSLNRVNGAL